jgi:hypothetical protein
MKKPEFQRLQVKIVMNEVQVFGVIAVPINGYRSRLSDLLNNNQDFLALTDVEIYQDQELIEKTSFMCINKHAIMFLSETGLHQESMDTDDSDESSLLMEMNYSSNDPLRAIA